MKRIKFLFQRIFSMDYKGLFNVAKTVHERTGKNRLLVMIDIVYSGIKFQAGYVDYLDFELYNVPHKNRSTFITRGLNFQYVTTLSDRDARRRLENKVVFLQDYEDLMGRKWCDLTQISYDEFKAFALDVVHLVAKPITGISGKGIQFYTASEENVESIYEKAMKDQTLLIEQEVIQHPAMARIHPLSINTIRVVTIQIEGRVGIPFLCLRTGNGNRVDNLNSGGFAAKIDPETGIVCSDGVGKFNRASALHPLTGIAFKGYKIPMFQEVLALAHAAALRAPHVGLVGWDVAISNQGPILIEGNDFPGHDIYQSPTFVGEAKIGMRPIFDAMINDLKGI